MKKEKIVITITVGIACLILVMVMFMQFKVTNRIDLASIETMTESELRSELVDIRERYEQLNIQYAETLVKLQEYKEEYKTDEETRVILEKELKQLQTILGTTDVQGQGIIITIREDNLQIENDRLYYDDLLILINALKGAGADAISVNDHRIITTTGIFDISNGLYVKVNGKRILPPYVIKAIGDPTYLESSLLGNGGYVDSLRKYGFDIDIERSNKITINAYSDGNNGEIKSEYMK